MRFLALETDVNAFKKRFLVQDEEELLTARKHVFLMVIALFSILLISIAVIPLSIVLMTAGGTLEDAGIMLLALWIVVALMWMLKAYIDWKFDFLIITTEKILLIDHTAFLAQHVETIRMEFITQPRSASQFLGIGRCGVLHLQLRSMDNIPARHLAVPYLPAPDLIAGTVEKAIVMLQQRGADKGVQGQQEKIEETRQNVRDEVSSAPPPFPAPDNT